MTIKQHLEQLPEPYNWLALEEAKRQGIYKSLSLIITNRTQSETLYLLSFNWDSSELGRHFWKGVYDNLIHLGK